MNKNKSTAYERQALIDQVLNVAVTCDDPGLFIFELYNALVELAEEAQFELH